MAMFWRASLVVNAPEMNTVFSVVSYQFLVPAGGPWSFNIGGIRLGVAAMAGLIVGFVLFRVRGNILSNDDATDAMVNLRVEEAVATSEMTHLRLYKTLWLHTYGR